MRSDILVSYDVNTEDNDGKRRLRRVAKVCKNYGQRVQHSVFECTVNEMDLDRLRAKLTKLIKPEDDSLRIYHLRGRREEYIEAYGCDRYMDFHGDVLVA
jgi:CRISPR-associated protein Cas2